MNTLKQIGVLVLVFVIGVACGSFFGREVVREVVVGNAAGTDHYDTERFWGGFGGGVLATSTSGTATTLSEDTLYKYSVIEITPNVASLTYTLPATSTLATLLKQAGDTRRWVFENATSTVATTLTVAKGVGWDLVGVDANVDVIAGAAAGSEVYMALDCTRKSNTDIVCLVTENIAVD